MNRRMLIMGVMLAVAVAAAVTGWRKVGQVRAEEEALQAQLQELQQQIAANANTAGSERDAELVSLRSQAQELLRLRNEVTQLRTGAKETEKLRSDNQQLRAENQKLRASTGPSSASSTPAAAKDQFPRDSWGFAGYATPDAALVSAIWSMKEGNPKTYLDSLAPEERERMSKIWENKSETEIAAKHQQDVSSITGMRVLDRRSISAEEVQMNVYIEGVDRMEKVSMKLINNEWKFGGFLRDAKK